MATLILERLKCDRQQEDGPDEIEVIAHAQSGLRRFRRDGFTSGSTWDLQKQLGIHGTMVIELWEIDSGRDAWIDADDHLGSVAISESELAGLKRFAKNGAHYTLRFRVQPDQVQSEESPGASESHRCCEDILIPLSSASAVSGRVARSHHSAGGADTTGQGSSSSHRNMFNEEPGDFGFVVSIRNTRQRSESEAEA